jgi:hypothetical protein
MNFSVSSLFAGFIFGVFGYSFFRYAKNKGNLAGILIGVALMIYPYFVSHEILVWVVGVVLLGLGFKTIYS